MKLLTSALSIALCVMSASAANATDLLQAWQAAQKHDPEFAAAEANFEAGATHRDQSEGMWLPSVSLTAGAGIQNSSTDTAGAHFSAPGFTATNGVAFDTSIRNGNMEQYALVARQPLLNRSLLSQSRQLGLSADMAEIEWQAARQQLAMRVAERYFDVLVAAETLRLLTQQKTAVEFELNQAQDSFKVGSIPVTDTYEALARFKNIEAQIMAANMDLQLKQSMFADLTGMGANDLLTLPVADASTSTTLAPIDSCIHAAAQSNPTLLIQEKKLAVAKEEAEKYRALSAPSVDLVAQLGYDKLHGNGDYGNAENLANNRMIGIQLTIPLFTGGIRSAKYSESVHLIDKTRSDSELLRQQIAQQVRTAWLGITVGESRVSALVQAHKASLARLDATRLGHSEGDRTTLDLLNAENDTTNAGLAVLQAKINVAMNRLKLAQLQGSLDEAALRLISNSTFSPTATNQ
ncbi:outer membrane protein [Oxalobacteraceae bacterium GrIS 2.11]